eukprot:559116-Pleurochrysis_carterae.AAC.1
MNPKTALKRKTNLTFQTNVWCEWIACKGWFRVKRTEVLPIERKSSAIAPRGGAPGGATTAVGSGLGRPTCACA